MLFVGGATRQHNNDRLPNTSAKLPTTHSGNPFNILQRRFKFIHLPPIERAIGPVHQCQQNGLLSFLATFPESGETPGANNTNTCKTG